jgi:hypothetical protein
VAATVRRVGMILPSRWYWNNGLSTRAAAAATATLQPGQKTQIATRRRSASGPPSPARRRRRAAGR